MLVSENTAPGAAKAPRSPRTSSARGPRSPPTSLLPKPHGFEGVVLPRVLVDPADQTLSEPERPGLLSLHCYAATTAPNPVADQRHNRIARFDEPGDFELHLTPGLLEASQAFTNSLHAAIAIPHRGAGRGAWGGTGRGRRSRPPGMLPPLTAPIVRRATPTFSRDTALSRSWACRSAAARVSSISG